MQKLKVEYTKKGGELSILEGIEKIMKQDAISYLSTQKKDLTKLSKKIFDLAEESYKEYESSKYICNFLSKHGFTIKRNFQNINTAFKATFGNGHPVICFTCEYDATTEKGHITGHNINSLIHIATAISLAHLSPKMKNPPTIMVVGCPGEYLGGSKETLLRQNVFNDVDAIFSIQANTTSCEIKSSASVIPVSVNFKSKYELSQSEYKCNYTSLDAILMMINILKVLEKGIHCTGGNVDYIISEATKDPFVKANDSTIKLLIRAKDMEAAKKIKEKVESISLYIAGLLDVDCEISLYQPPSESINSNQTLSRLLSHNLKESGITHISEKRTTLDGISLGGLSCKIPTALHLVSITSDAEYGTSEFAKATLKPSTIEISLNAASALVNTVIDLTESPYLLKEALAEFETQKSPLY